MPDLNGMTVRRAKVALAKVRLEIDARTAVQDGPPDVAIGQSPQLGSVVAIGDSVIVCSRVQQRVPSVAGLSLEDASKVLGDAGYQVVRNNSFVSRESQMGVVMRQQPAAGSRLSRGGTDTVVVGMASPISKIVRAQPPKPLVPLTDATPPTGPPEPRIIVVREPPIPPSLWKWLTGVIALLAVGMFARRLRRQPELKTLRVTPHRDQGHPRVVIAIHADTSPNE